MSQNTKFYVFITMFLVAVALGTNAVSIAVGGPDAPWRTLVKNLGGTYAPNDKDGRPCAWFEKDQQLICYNTMDMWYGQDAKPAYVVEHGTCTAIYDQCP